MLARKLFNKLKSIIEVSGADESNRRFICLLWDSPCKGTVPFKELCNEFAVEWLQTKGTEIRGLINNDKVAEQIKLNNPIELYITGHPSVHHTHYSFRNNIKDYLDTTHYLIVGVVEHMLLHLCYDKASGNKSMANLIRRWEEHHHKELDDEVNELIKEIIDYWKE